MGRHKQSTRADSGLEEMAGGHSLSTFWWSLPPCPGHQKVCHLPCQESNYQSIMRPRVCWRPDSWSSWSQLVPSGFAFSRGVLGGCSFPSYL